MKELVYFETEVTDYEHSGDLSSEISIIKSECPEATNFKSWEERDYEAESDSDDEEDYSEPIYRGYVSFYAPKHCVDNLKSLGYYPSKNNYD